MRAELQAGVIVFEETRVTDFTADTARVRACQRQCRLANPEGSCTCWMPKDCRFRLPFNPKQFVSNLAFFGDGNFYFPHVEGEIEATYGG